MGELNKKKGKHNHSLTDLLKVGIFSLIMLAPFLSIGVRCGYVMWNKNAKDSYSSSSTISTYNSITQVNTLPNNTNVYFKIEYTGRNGYTPLFDFYSTDLDLATLFPNKTVNYVGAYTANNTIYIVAVTDNYADRTLYRDDSITQFNITTKGNRLTGGTDTNSSNFGMYIYTYKALTLDNAFSYSVSQISNDPIFNWTRNTGIYQPINAMCTGLELEHDTMQILLAYWSLMTAIYIVFDLIIFCFTKLTHFINS